MKYRLRIKANVAQFREWLEFYTTDLHRRGIYPNLQPAKSYESLYEVVTFDHMAIYRTGDNGHMNPAIVVEIVVYDAVSLLVAVIQHDPLIAVTDCVNRLEDAICMRFEKMDIDDSLHTPTQEVNPSAAPNIAQELKKTVSETGQQDHDTIETSEFALDKYDTAKLREMLNKAFDDEGFNAFCFDHFRFTYDKFSIGMTRTAKIQHLMEDCSRLKNLGKLLRLLKRHMSHLPWQETYKT